MRKLRSDFEKVEKKFIFANIFNFFIYIINISNILNINQIIIKKIKTWNRYIKDYFIKTIFCFYKFKKLEGNFFLR